MRLIRTLILSTLLGILLILGAAPDSHAEKRIGVIMSGDVPYYGAIHRSFVAELNKQFASSGEKFEIILQRPFPNPISWSNAARKLIAFDVDLIVTYGSSATLAVTHEKTDIPLVYAGVYEPDQVISPKETMAGCGFKIPLSSVVRYLKRLKPLSTLGIIYSSIEDDSARQFHAIKELAAQQNITPIGFDLRSRTDLNKLRTSNEDAVFITGSATAHLWLDDILSVLETARTPTADIFPDDSESGVLITLYQPPQAQGQVAAEMAVQILRGGKAVPAPRIFRDTELVFNVAAARHLGITFPIPMVIEATKVIE